MTPQAVVMEAVRDLPGGAQRITAPAAIRTAYRPDIDGLRAVAVLLVVIHHAFPQSGGGFIGVDVFFVISGYLITGILAGDIRQSRFRLAGFYVESLAHFVHIAPVVLPGIRNDLSNHFFGQRKARFRSRSNFTGRNRMDTLTDCVEERLFRFGLGRVFGFERGIVFVAHGIILLSPLLRLRHRRCRGMFGFGLSIGHRRA